ncbi:MAG: hypothetical protein COT14_03285 [Candidatus Diapherotrites archaeon CG08_land_8_20_14_0_20_30_16]|nr:MAG: hypothetical protein COT14_03285 [Candidatus Diapherotrites archaeon CG08_land_8_20_14_0_20_30_16]
MILGIIAFFFIITFPIALVWFSISGSILDADTYKPVVPLLLDSMINQNLSQTGLQISEESLKQIEPLFYTWLDDIFDYVNAKTDKLNLKLPSDDVLKPAVKQLLLSTIKQSTPNGGQLTNEQVDALLEQAYPAMKQQLQTSINSFNIQLESQLLQARDILSLARLVGIIALILSLVFIIFAIVLIWQVRSIMNWIGTYFLLGSVPLLLIALGLIFGLNSILQSASLPQEAILPATSIVSAVFNNLAIFSGIFTVIGLALLFVKYAFPKAVKEPAK